jgi:hypothetical protein
VVPVAPAADWPDDALPPSEFTRVTTPTIAVISVATPVSTPGKDVQNAQNPRPRDVRASSEEEPSFPISGTLRVELDRTPTAP